MDGGGPADKPTGETFCTLYSNRRKRPGGPEKHSGFFYKVKSQEKRVKRREKKREKTKK
jgi:hypothetical protein